MRGPGVLNGMGRVSEFIVLSGSIGVCQRFSEASKVSTDVSVSLLSVSLAFIKDKRTLLGGRAFYRSRPWQIIIEINFHHFLTWPGGQQGLIIEVILIVSKLKVASRGVRGAMHATVLSGHRRRKAWMRSILSDFYIYGFGDILSVTAQRPGSFAVVPGDTDSGAQGE